MPALRDRISSVPLLDFLDLYPEPAFLLSTDSLPHLSIEFVYGNPALSDLVLGYDDLGVLDNDAFFSAITSSEDVLWLSNPVHSSPVSHTSQFRTIDIRPAWLPRDHTPFDLELTPTPITLPITVPGISLSSKCYVFISSPRKVAMDMLRSGSKPRTETSKRRGSELRLSGSPSLSASIRQRKSRNSATETSSKSQHVHKVDSASMPSSLIDTFPWEKSPLGPKSSWPVVLKTMAKYVLDVPIASTLLWGWPHLVMIYNDPYGRVMGNKHPGAFGQPASIAWGELWDMLAPLSLLSRQGTPVSKTDDMLFFNTLTELHLPEEFYHSWHWTPVYIEDGSVGGLFCSTYETTQKVIAERRLAGMSELSASLANARDRKDYAERVLGVLEKNPLDIPFVAMYWCDVENVPNESLDSKRPPLAADYLRPFFSTAPVSATFTFAGAIGVPEGHLARQKTIKYTLDPTTYQPLPVPTESRVESASPALSEHTLPPQTHMRPAGPGHSDSDTSIGSQIPPVMLASVFASGHIEPVDPLPAQFASSLETRGFGDTPRSAFLLPIIANFGQSATRGDKPFPQAVILVGQNTRRAYDADYAAWLEDMCASLSNHLTLMLQREADARMIEEREKMDKAKTLFFTNTSHELRTPLTLIQAPLEQLLSSPSLPESLRYKVQLATRNATRLKKLVDSVLDISKLEAGRLQGAFRPVNLGRITSDLAALFRSMAEKKGLELEVVDANYSAPLVYVDIDLWEKIVCNLLSNAFKYTIHGKITVQITYDAVSTYVQIKDTGVGITKDHLDHVFERFHRGGNNIAEGTGIGLSLTKAGVPTIFLRASSLHLLIQELITLHGGELSVTSRSNQDHPDDSGSEFMVKIPLGHAHLPEGPTQDAHEQKTRGTSVIEMEYWMGVDAGYTTSSVASTDDDEESAASSTLFFRKDDTILVVDDNEDMRGYVRKIFSPYLTVLEARDGFEALSIIKLQRLNAILCDVMMPGMSGLELLAKLREKKRTRLVPVIFVTASDDDSLISGKVEGVVDCVTKPFRVRDLLARVHLQVQLGKRIISLEEEFDVRSRELQVLTDLSPVGIFRTNVTGQLTYVNPTWNQVTNLPAGADRDEWLDSVHPASTQDAVRIWRNCFSDYKMASVRLRWKSDTWTHVSISPMFTPDDTFAGAFGALTDITDQHRAEEARIALAEEKEHIAALKAKDAEEQRLLEVERRRAQELLIDVTSHELRQPVSAIIQNAEVVRANMRAMRDLLQDCHRKNASYVPTERVLVELEEDLQAMESITQCGLAQARIANDVLSLSRIQLDVLPVVPTEFDIRRETGQILTVFRNELMSKDINFTLDLGLGADLLGCKTVNTDRSRFAQIITNLMSNAIRFTDMNTSTREIQVTLEIALDPPADDTCAPPPILPRPTTISHPEDPDSTATPVYIYVSVKDSGPGLTKEDLALLFQRFQQGSNAHHVFGGSGLGLFVCRQLCGLMSGRIEVKSEAGKGAMFRFFIRGSLPDAGRTARESPAATRVGKPVSVHSRISGESKGTGGPLHVLITEDNKINRTVLARQMKHAGFTYSLASNGLEAVHAIESFDAAESGRTTPGMFDVMDLEMPVMDGFTAMREIRKRELSGSLKMRSFIIALTGNARLEQVEAARDAGADDVIIKPYQIESLIDKMQAGHGLLNTATTTKT